MNLSSSDKLALMSFSSLERQATYQVLCGMMAVDGDRDPREKRILEDCMAVMNFTESERVASRSLSVNQQLQILKSMDYLQKIVLAKCLANVSIADGVVTREENGLFMYLLDILDLPADPDDLFR